MKGVLDWLSFQWLTADITGTGADWIIGIGTILILWSFWESMVEHNENAPLVVSVTMFAWFMLL